MKERKLSSKHLSMFLLMNQWVKAKQKGNNIIDVLNNKGYKNIAIYGMSYIGETLYRDLQNQISVLYCIDQKPYEVYGDIEILHPSDDLPEVDAIIVTSFFYYDEIRRDLSNKVSCPIISIEALINTL